MLIFLTTLIPKIRKSGLKDIAKHSTG